MIYHNRQIPLKILQNEALLRRLPPNHLKIPIIEKDLKKRKAGFKGEKTVDYHLSFLTDKKYMIFHDIRLPLDPHFFQIDTLLLTPHYALIIEVKNYSGIMRVDPQIRQCTRIYKDVKEGIADPVSQAQRQRFLLRKWLSVNKLTSLPIEVLVVISNPSTTLEFTVRPDSNSPYLNIIHSQNLIHHITDLNNDYPKRAVSEKDLSKTKRKILSRHTALEQNILEIYGISKQDILTGVQCENCGFIPMERVSASWVCLRCSHKSKSSHILAINDYFLLVSKRLTNNTLREFIHLESAAVASMILKSLKLESSGVGKGTYYRKRNH